MNISQLTINSKIVDSLTKCGYENLTEVQASVLEPALAGSDLLVRSQTGSGKTMAFAIPLVNNLTTNKGIEVLVVCPTRELAQQVASEVRKLTRKLGDEFVNTIYGGAPIYKQISTLKSGRTKIVVGTPGRILDHIKRGTLNLSTVKSVVLDEADEMLNMGFLEDIQSILDHVPAEHQTLLFSATYPANIVKLANKYLTNPTKIEIGVDNASLDSIKQEHVHVDRRNKSAALVRILTERTPALTIVFCNTKSMTEELAKLLRDNGFRASALNGDMRQNIRTKMMRNIKEGKSNILVATDVAARGIDIKDVSYIINYDIPNNSEFYLHRIGRTARAGKEGNSVSITTTKQQQRQVLTIARETHSTIHKYHMDGLIAMTGGDALDDMPLQVTNVKSVDSRGNAITVSKSKPKSKSNQPKQTAQPKGKDSTKRTRSNKFQSSEYMALMADGVDSNDAIATAKASKYTIDYNHPQDTAKDNWLEDEFADTNKKSRYKSRDNANKSRNDKSFGECAKSGDRSKSNDKSKSNDRSKKSSSTDGKPNRYGKDYKSASSTEGKQGKKYGSKFDKGAVSPDNDKSAKVDKSKTNKYLAECVESVNNGTATKPTKAKSKSYTKTARHDKADNVADKSIEASDTMPQIKRKTTNKKSKQYNHYSQ